MRIHDDQEHRGIAGAAGEIRGDQAEHVPANAEDSGKIEVLPDGSVSVPILEEVPVVTKRVIVRERVIVRKKTSTKTETINTRAKRERVKVKVDTQD